MPGIKRSLARLLFVQSGWTYERMGGVGVACAARSLLEEGLPADRRAAAIARSAEFFNSHPWLAGLAVGAEARAERDGVDPEQIRRLRAALGGPLGALGDRTIWAGLFPLLSASALLAALFVGWPAALAAVLMALVVRLEMTRWALLRGLGAGMQVAGALKRSILTRHQLTLGYAAAFAVGVAGAFFAFGTSRIAALAVRPSFLAPLAFLFLVIVLRAGARLPAYRLGLLLGLLVVLLRPLVHL